MQVACFKNSVSHRLVQTVRFFFSFFFLLLFLHIQISFPKSERQKVTFLNSHAVFVHKLAHICQVRKAIYYFYTFL